MVSALIFANGDLNDGPAVRSALEIAPPRLVIAVDGGLRHVQTCGLQPDLVVGDMDSVDPTWLSAAHEHGAEILRYPAHKNETDLELALIAAAKRDCETIRIIGAVGDRLDQTFGNVFLLALSVLHPLLKRRDTRLVSGKQTIWLAYPGQNVIDGAPGDTVSLIPLNETVTNIVTEALEYPLRGEILRFGPARGISNVMLTTQALVEYQSGLLLIIHTVGRA